MAGITNAATVSLLTGLTVGAAAEKYLVAFQLAVANAGLERGSIKVYTMTGQHVETDVEQARAMVQFLKTMRSGGGGVSLPVGFMA